MLRFERKDEGQIDLIFMNHSALLLLSLCANAIMKRDEDAFLLLRPCMHTII